MSYSNDSLDAFNDFKTITEKLNSGGLADFMALVQDYVSEYLENNDNSSIMMSAVQQKCLDLISRSENNGIQIFDSGTCHVDSFLYDDTQIDDLCAEAKFSRNYCSKCSSTAIEDFKFITHSMSLVQLHYLFKYVLEEAKNCDIMVDIGSRTGAILYGAVFFSTIPKAIGIEIDPAFCQLQEQIIEEFGLSSRVQVLKGNFVNHLEVISSAHIIILNNVFEYFCSEAEQKEYWKSLHVTIPKNCKIITSPSLEESFSKLNFELSVPLTSWVSQSDLSSIQMKYLRRHVRLKDHEDHEILGLHCYTVL